MTCLFSLVVGSVLGMAVGLNPLVIGTVLFAASFIPNEQGVLRMGLSCTCPVATALTAIPANSCIEEAGQIQKLLFQRIMSATAGVKNKITGATAATKTTWTTLIAASDATKMIVTPFIESPEMEVGAKKEFGGGNGTLGGIPIITGRDFSTFKGVIYRTRQNVVSVMKLLQCENIGVYMIDEYGRIFCLTDNMTTPASGNYYPIPIKSFFIGDKKFAGMEEPDSNSFEFRFMPNYSDMLSPITGLAWDALTELG